MNCKLFLLLISSGSIPIQCSLSMSAKKATAGPSSTRSLSSAQLTQKASAAPNTFPEAVRSVLQVPKFQGQAEAAAISRGRLQALVGTIASDDMVFISMNIYGPNGRVIDAPEIGEFVLVKKSDDKYVYAQVVPDAKPKKDLFKVVYQFTSANIPKAERSRDIRIFTDRPKKLDGLLSLLELFDTKAVARINEAQPIEISSLVENPEDLVSEYDLATATNTARNKTLSKPIADLPDYRIEKSNKSGKKKTMQWGTVQRVDLYETYPDVEDVVKP